MVTISVHLICWAEALFVRIFGTPLIKIPLTLARTPLITRPLTLARAMISYIQDISENNDTYYCLSSFSDFGQSILILVGFCFQVVQLVCHEFWLCKILNVSCPVMWGLPVFKAGWNKSKCRKINLWVTSLVDSCRVSPEWRFYAIINILSTKQGLQTLGNSPSIVQWKSISSGP